MSIHTTHEFAPADRYLYDFKICTYAKGWAQVDTRQDAWYHGIWTNPTERKIFSYVEGDTYLTECDTELDYGAALRDVAAWQRTNGYWLGIDPGLKAEMRQRFIDLGLGDLLHGS